MSENNDNREGTEGGRSGKGSKGGIDAHQHFWIFDPVRDSWINNDMSVIQRDFLPDDLEPHLAAAGLEGSIVVQCDQSEDENDFLLGIAAKSDLIKGVIGWVDLQSPALGERLEYYKRFPKLKGFRHILQGERDRALMLNPDFIRGVELLQQYGYTYDILIYPDQLGYTRDFAAALPGQRMVIDHIAKPHIKDNRLANEWRTAIKAVAEHRQVYCKVSGMVTEADWRHWKPADLRPFLDTVVEAFGMDRLMYGSDWPVCLVAANYEEVISVVRDYFSAFSKEEQAAFFGGNAMRFYNL